MANSNIYGKLTPAERILKTKILLQKTNPFFSYLLMSLKIQDYKDLLGELTPEQKKELEKKKKEDGHLATMGVDAYGNLYYDADWVETLTDDELKGVLVHEVMHCVLEHMDRCGNRYHELFNIAGDVVINNMLVNNHLNLPKKVIVPSSNECDVMGFHIKNIQEKSAEMLYDELWRKLADKFNRDTSKMKQHIKKHGGNYGFDTHIYDKGGKLAKKNKNQQKPDWKKVTTDALHYAKSRGDTPAGMERELGRLNETFIDWRGLLYRYITSQIPVDYNWAKPSKRSQALGFYMPGVVKESIDIIAAIDTSGSISPRELTEFLSEVCGIISKFKNVNLTVIDCDCRVNGAQDFKNVTADDIKSRIKLRGGGGTSHIPVFNWINKNKPAAKLLIAFTDGYTEFPKPKDVKINTIWVVAGRYRAKEENFPFGQVVTIPLSDTEDY